MFPLVSFRCHTCKWALWINAWPCKNNNFACRSESRYDYHWRGLRLLAAAQHPAFCSPSCSSSTTAPPFFFFFWYQTVFDWRVLKFWLLIFTALREPPHCSHSADEEFEATDLFLHWPAFLTLLCNYNLECSKIIMSAAKSVKKCSTNMRNI